MQTADTSSLDETLILVGTNFVTGPVTLIQNYSLLKLVIIQSSMHLRQIQKIPNWQQLYIFASKNVLHIVFHHVPCCTWSSPKTSLCTVTEMILCRGISGLHWTALEHHNLDYDLYNLPFLRENLIPGREILKETDFALGGKRNTCDVHSVLQCMQKVGS